MTSFGPRVVGDYANEVQTPEMIEEEVQEAIFKAHSSQSILVEVSLIYYIKYLINFESQSYLISNYFLNILNCWSSSSQKK